MSVAGSWSDTPQCAADSGQDLVAVFSSGEGEITSYIDRNRHQVGSFVTRETRSKVMSLTAPVMVNDHHKDRCFPLKLQVEPFLRIRTSCDRAQECSCE